MSLGYPPAGEAAAPPPFSLFGFPVPGVATAHFLARRTAIWAREPALTHVLLEGVGGEQRHLADARALVAAVWLRIGSCSGFGDPRPRLPRRLGSDRVLALPPPHLPDSCLTGQLRVRAPPPRSTGDSPPRASSHQPQAFSQRPCPRCSMGGGGSPGPRPPYGSGDCRCHLSIARTPARHGTGTFRAGSCRAQNWATPEPRKQDWR